MTEFKNIRPQSLHQAEYYQTKRLELHLQEKKETASKACLLKYFPKYYKDIKMQFSYKESVVVSRLKQVKTIQHLSCEVDGNDNRKKPDAAPNRLKEKIFRNKRKSLQSLPTFSRETQPLPKGRITPQISFFLPRVADLDLSRIFRQYYSTKEIQYVNKDLEEQIKSYYGQFWKSLRYVKHLKLSNENYYSWLVIKEINDSPRFLKSLKTLRFSLQFFHRDTIKQVRGYLSVLSQNKLFLQQLTHLNCQYFGEFLYYDELISSILAQCPKLVSLTISIGRQKYYYKTPDEIYIEYPGTQVFKQLRNMSQLQILDVKVHGFKSFIKHFSPPASLKKMTLTIAHSFYDMSLMNLFENPEFFQHFKGLIHLETLKIDLPRIKEPNEFLRKFIMPLLQMTPSLKKLRLKILETPGYQDICEPIDLSLLLEGMESHLKFLKDFKIVNCPAQDSKYKDSTTESLIGFDPKNLKTISFLSNLNKVDIHSEFFTDFDFQTFLLQVFAASNTHGKNNRTAKTKRLKLSTLSLNSVETMQEYLKAVNDLVIAKNNGGENIEINLELTLALKNLNELFDSLKETIILEKDVAIKLNIYVISQDTQQETWRFGRDCEPGVQKLKLSEQENGKFKRIFSNIQLNLTHIILGARRFVWEKYICYEIIFHSRPRTQPSFLNIK